MKKEDTLLEELTENEFEKALAQLFRRSQTDLAFRELCLRDAEAALIEISGKRPPSGKKFMFSDKAETE